ncbi:MAG: alpha-L-rhamnosidase, partial [Bacteroidetes bacterium]|nr:alpha-L-rhamnosidase [Bacteroidota bacterium]
TPGTWITELDGKSAAALTFRFREENIGFPFFTIEAPRNTIIELMVQEGHTPGGQPLLNSHFHAWSRFICSGGRQTFQTFDFEASKWLQLHIRGTKGTVAVSNVGILKRTFPWPDTPGVQVGEPALQRLMDASIRTLHNSAQETAVDGMGRERQQYSGDGAHQLHAVYLAYGEHRLPARFLSTFSQGLMHEGYFFDCWPAFDRLVRVMERQLHMTPWGPLLDHSVGFGFDCFHHYLYTGDLDPVREPFIRYQRFVRYLHRIRRPDGLLPVSGLGTPAVWIDHDAYPGGRQEHKECAFNLYAAAMLQRAFAPLARALGDGAWGDFADAFGKEIQSALVRHFWSKGDGLFVNNLPWIAEEKAMRLCDRSIATAVLFDLCPDDITGPAIEALASPPPHMGLSYPANACWRYWALARGGRTDVVLRDFRERWATMDSVILNNTIGENWKPFPDSGDLWSHCAVVPLYVLIMGIAGIQPTAPGFARCRLRPQPADLDHMAVTVPTVRGPLSLRTDGPKGDRAVRIRIPETSDAELVLDAREHVPLKQLRRSPDGRTDVYALASGIEHVLHLVHT